MRTHQQPAATTPRPRYLCGAMLVALLAGCAAGPDFKRPAAPAVSAYTAAPLPAQTASSATDLGGEQHFITGVSAGEQWWRKLGSPKLDALIAKLKSTTDDKARVAVVAQLERYVIDLALWIPLWDPVNYIALQPRVKGVFLDSQGNLILNNVTLSS